MAQILPTDESFAAPDWLTVRSDAALGNCSPWFFWYLGWKPTTAVSTSAGDGASYPYRVGAELESYGRQELYVQSGSGNPPIMPVLMTSTSGIGQELQRSVLCRAEDAVAVEDVDIKIIFGILGAGGSSLGTSHGGRDGSSPTQGGRYPFPAGDPGDTTADHFGLTGGPGAGNWTSGGNRNPIPPRPLIEWALWNGNSIFFRAGSGYPSVNYASAAGTGSRAWWCDRVDHYSFCAYPVINAGASRVDLYLELWQVAFSGTGATDGTARRLIQQVVDGGASQVDFTQPYFLRVTCDNNGSGNVDINAYIGEYLQTAAPNLNQAQIFKDGVFANDTFTVGSSVSHNSTTGNVEDQHADKITAFADKTFGWGMGRDRTIDVSGRLFLTVPMYMSGIEGVFSVEVKDISAATVLYRDEFLRSVTGGINAPTILNPIVGLFGQYGNQINGLFTFDAYAEEFEAGTSGVRRLLQWTALPPTTSVPQDYARIDYDADNSTTAGEQCFDVMRCFVYGRPSTQYYNHHRSIEFRPGTENPTAGTVEVASINYEIGLGLRGSFDGKNISGMIGYLTWYTDAEETVTQAALVLGTRNLDYDDTSPSTQIIARKHWVSAADVAAFNSAYPLYDGNYHTLDLKVEVTATAAAPQAAAIYHVELDGNPIELDDAAQPYQSGTVTPYPVVENGPAYWFGKQECVFFYCNQPEYETTGFKNYIVPRMRNWVEGAMTDDPISGGDDYQESIVVGGEGTPVGSLNAVSGALAISGGGVWDVEVEVTVESAFPIRRLRFESGHTYTSPAATKARRRWRVTVRAAAIAVYQSLQSFYNSHDGIEIPFSFVVPVPDDGTETGHTAEDTETVSAWFSDDVLDIAEIGPQIYDISFSLEELLVT
tara:strand:- start:21251 stop:23893 length:2643 start_codon:yes stop_codon:yes gene_type:complete